MKLTGARERYVAAALGGWIALLFLAPTTGWTWSRAHPRTGNYSVGSTLTQAKDLVRSPFNGALTPQYGEIFVVAEREHDAHRRRVLRWSVTNFSLGALTCNGLATEEELDAWRGGIPLGHITRFGFFAWAGSATLGRSGHTSGRYLVFRGRFLTPTRAAGTYEVKGCDRQPFVAVLYRARDHHEPH